MSFTGIHVAISVDVDRFSDAKIRRQYLPFFRQLGAKTPEDVRRLCNDERAKGHEVFPPCDKVKPNGACAGHRDPNAPPKRCVLCMKPHGRRSREAYACALEQLERCVPGAPGWGSYEAWLAHFDAIGALEKKVQALKAEMGVADDVDELTRILREANGL